MVKPALAAERAVRVLDFLSMHPGQPHTLTEIAAAIDVNAPSLLAVLAALTDGGYLVRHPVHKTYALGAALAGVGHAALVQHPVVAVAQDELEVLAGEIDAQLAASVLLGREVMAVAVAGRPRRTTTWTQIGTRFPFIAPFGAPFAAHGPAGLRARWLMVEDPDRRERLGAALDVVRERGFATGREDDVREQIGRAARALADEPADRALHERVDGLLTALQDGFVEANLASEPMAVSHVTVPVFSPEAEVVMILSCGGFGEAVAGAAVDEIARRTAVSAAAIAAQALGLRWGGSRRTPLT